MKDKGNHIWQVIVIYFISHMVQMKDGVYTCYSICTSTLYPTWFRWKSRFISLWALSEDLYIPHGSDER